MKSTNRKTAKRTRAATAPSQKGELPRSSNAAQGKSNGHHLVNTIREVSVTEIEIGDRHRKDFGDLTSLAADIKQIGLLQPVGITETFKLVFGERRLRACAHILKWKTIPARIVNVASIVAGEKSENDMRKDFTPSERVAIAKSLEAEIQERRGNPSIRLKRDELDGRTDSIIAKKAGFRDRNAYRRAKKVVENGSPELVAAMDSGTVAISTAAKLAVTPLSKQDEVLNLDGRKIRQSVRNLREAQLGNARNGKHHSISNSARLATNGSPQLTVQSPAKDNSISVIFSDLKNHRETMEMVLMPICDENRHVPLELAQKRILVRLLRETKNLHTDLEQTLSARPGADI